MSEQQEAEDHKDAEDGGEQSEAQAKAQEAEQESEEAKQEMESLEEDPPEKLEDWPTGAAKYETFGGPEGDHSYEEGPESKLGPSGVRHHEGGEVTVDGEEVDNPDEFKGEPVPGGPTDPEAPENRNEEEGQESE